MSARRVVNGEEVDAHTSWRRLLYWHRGELAAAKRRTRRRARRSPGPASPA